MGDMTLRELCELVGVTRRAIQGYERIGLVSATSKNKYGYLLYDKSTKERIEKIILFQNMEFTLKEIKEIIDAPKEILKPAIEKQIEKLILKQSKIEKTIIQAQEMISNM